MHAVQQQKWAWPKGGVVVKNKMDNNASSPPHGLNYHTPLRNLFSKIINKFKSVVDRGQDFSRAGDAQFCWGWGRVSPMKFDIGRGFVYMGIAGSGPGQ